MSATKTARLDFELLPYQKEPFEKLLACFKEWHETGVNRGRLFVMPTRCGKTFVIAKALAKAKEMGYLPEARPLATASVLIFTVKNAVIQTQRVMLRANYKEAIVTSHMSMAHSFGDGILNWVSMIRNNHPTMVPLWDEDLKPYAIVVDENQYVKNEDAIIAQVVASAVKQGILVIMVSATPFAKPSETTVTNLALKLINDQEDNYYFMSKFQARGSVYSEYSPGTMRNYNEYLLERGLKIEATDIKFAHRVFNKVVMVKFKRAEHRKMYEDALAEWLKELEEAGRQPPQNQRAFRWAADQKFWQKAELVRIEQIAEVAVKIQKTTNKQLLIAFNYRDSIELCLEMLQRIHGISRDDICVIMGGQASQKERDEYQYGKRNYCLLTLKAGGVGLELSHQNPQARPRYGIMPPTYSPIGFVQLIGRDHGPTSLSTTHNDVVLLEDTIEEEKVAPKLKLGMTSLREMVSKKEQWRELWTGFSKEEAAAQARDLEEAAKAAAPDDGDNEFLAEGLALEALSTPEGGEDDTSN